MPGPHQGRARGSAGVLAVLLLLPALALAGCLTEPTTQLTVRPGDLVRAEVAVTRNETLVFPVTPDANATILPCSAGQTPEGTPCTHPVGPYAVAQQVPATLPEGWVGTMALPPGVIDQILGLSEGQALEAQDVAAFGDHDPDLVETHPRTTWLPRTVDQAQAYGRAWNTTELEGGKHRIEPRQADNGTHVEVPRWCNERFCLFESQLVSWNATHLQVHHLAEPGEQVSIPALDTHLTVARAENGTVVIDGNDPRSKATYNVHVKVHEIRTPPEGQRRAPSFTLTTLAGDETSLTDHAGQPLVLEFFASWCPSCRKNAEHLNRLSATYGNQVAILSIDVDPWESREDLEAFIRAHNVSWPVALDEQGKVSRAYRVGSLSTEVIISPQGAIVHVETGVADHERVSRIVHDLLPPDHHGDTGPEDHP